MTVCQWRSLIVALLTLAVLVPPVVQADSSSDPVGTLEPACAGGDGSACNALGDIYSSDKQVPIDYPRAFTYYLKGCEKLNAAACTNAGWSYARGEGTEVSPREAWRYYAMGCELGNRLGCTNAGKITNALQEGLAYSPKLTPARNHSQKYFWDHACRLGSTDACALARTFQRPERFSSIWAPYRADRKMLHCLDGSAQDCAAVAVILEGNEYVDLLDINNPGIPKKTQDFEMSRLLYRRACDLGHGAACSDLGVNYAQGNHVFQSYAMAIDLYVEACDLGNGGGCSNGGILFHFGRGVAKKPDVAVHYMHKACELGSQPGCAALTQALSGKPNPWLPTSEYANGLRSGCQSGKTADCRALAAVYQQGIGAPESDFLAAGYHARACELGDAEACRALAGRFERGDGVSNDPLRARDFYEKSCNTGIFAACADLQRMGL